jgi:hypothetical protein
VANVRKSPTREEVTRRVSGEKTPVTQEAGESIITAKKKRECVSGCKNSHKEKVPVLLIQRGSIMEITLTFGTTEGDSGHRMTREMP